MAKLVELRNKGWGQGFWRGLNKENNLLEFGDHDYRRKLLNLGNNATRRSDFYITCPC